MVPMQPDPDAPIYESVRRNQSYWDDAMMRKNAEAIGYSMGRGILRFSQYMNGFAVGLAQAKTEATTALDEESDDDDDDHYA